MKELIPWRHKVQYYETDQMKIVHHSNYIRWFEEARTWIMEEIGFAYHLMEEEGIIIPVLGVSAEYKDMTYFGETVIIEAYFLSFNGIKMTISYTVKNAIDGRIKAIGKSNHCFLNKKTNKPLNLKKSHPEIYNLFLNYTNQ